MVQENQLARCPFARSGRADRLLHERHPRLAEDIDQERQTRLKEMAYKISQRDEEKKLSSSFKTRFGSLDESVVGSPTPERVNRKSKTAQNEPITPVLRPQDSQGDLIFDMDEEEPTLAGSLRSLPAPRSTGPHQLDLPPTSDPRKTSKGKVIEVAGTPIASPSDSLPYTPVMSHGSPSESIARKASEGGNPWGSSTFSTSRLNLREVLAESKPAQSALSAGLAAENKGASARAAPQKMSQKERKKYLQQQAESVAQADAKAQQQPWTTVSDKKEPPWQQPAATPKPSLKDMLSANAGLKGPSPTPKPLVAAESSTGGDSIPRRTASPDTRFPGQKTSMVPTNSVKSSRPEPQPLMPHSKSYIQRPPQPELEMGVGLADIIGQQQREQESVREAVAKRSLQDIQEEQAFQEWWDQETRLFQEEEARRIAREARERGRSSGSGSGSGGSRKSRSNRSNGGNSRGRGGAGSGANNSSSSAAEASSSSATAQTQHGGGGGRGGRTRGNHRRGKTQ